MTTKRKRSECEAAIRRSIPECMRDLPKPGPKGFMYVDGLAADLCNFAVKGLLDDVDARIAKTLTEYDFVGLVQAYLTAEGVKYPELTITEIAQCSAECAVDQRHEYDSFEASLEAYANNAKDTAIELGYSFDQAVDCSFLTVRLGKEFVS